MTKTESEVGTWTRVNYGMVQYNKIIKVRLKYNQKGRE